MVDDEFRSYRDRDLLAPTQTSRGGIDDLLAELARLAEQYHPHPPTLSLTGSDDCHESDIQAAGRPRRRHGPVMVIAMLGLATLVAVGAFANRAVFRGPALPTPPSTLKSDNEPNKIVPNYGDAQPSKPASIASAELGEKIESPWPVDNQEQPKTALNSSNPRAALPSVLESWGGRPDCDPVSWFSARASGTHRSISTVANSRAAFPEAEEDSRGHHAL